jgi:hypothetical protein
MDDLAPYIYRTHDFGKTWTKVTEGIATPAYVHVVREDPVRKGLLFAGTEMGVYVSFDDGARWQPFQLNLPAASIRDLVIKDNDLVVATHGRAFWILDNITPLRQLTPSVVSDIVHLFEPAVAICLRKNESRDTPLPPETPAGTNPPAGAFIDYAFKSVPAGDVVLEIFDNRGILVRRFSSSDAVARVEDTHSFPTYWLRPEQALSKHSGLNRFVWNLRYAKPQALQYDYSIAAVYGEDTPTSPQGPLVAPGIYQVRLTVGGRSYNTPLEVKMDPRVSVATADLQKQLDLELRINRALEESYLAARQAQDLIRQLKEVTMAKNATSDGGALSKAAAELSRKASTLLNGIPNDRQADPGLTAVNASLASLMTAAGASDAAPTAQAIKAFDDNRQALTRLLTVWRNLQQTDLANFNRLSKGAGSPIVEIGAASNQ